MGGYEHFALDASHVYYSTLSLIVLINLVFSGIFAINLAKANGVK